MYLFEYQGQELFLQYAIPTPRCIVIKKDDHINIPKELGEEVVVKVQIPFGKRGEQGGIKICPRNQASKLIKAFFQSPFEGFVVSKVLVVEKLDIVGEMYMSITVDRNEKCLALLFCEQGGIDIEEIAKKFPEKLIKTCIAARSKLISHAHFSKILEKVFHKMPENNIKQKMTDIAQKLIQLAEEQDAILAEINPLVVTSDEEVIAADAKITIDDNALFRHPSFIKEVEGISSEIEKKAHSYNLEYVELKGTIGVIGNGAGLTMASIDVLEFYGGSPAHFLDIGGGADLEKVKHALEVCVMNKGIKALFINIFGGITHCDEVARGIIGFQQSQALKIPMAIRLIGTNENEGRQILEKDGIHVMDSMEQAAQQAIKLAL